MLKKRYLQLLDEKRVGTRIVFPNWTSKPSAMRPHEVMQPRWLYAFRCVGFVKVGQSTDWRRRMMSLQESCPLDLSILAVREVPNAGVNYAEAYALRHMPRPHRGEWFHADSSEHDSIRRIIDRAARRGNAYAQHVRMDMEGDAEGNVN